MLLPKRGSAKRREFLFKLTACAISLTAPAMMLTGAYFEAFGPKETALNEKSVEREQAERNRGCAPVLPVSRTEASHRAITPTPGGRST